MASKSVIGRLHVVTTANLCSIALTSREGAVHIDVPVCQREGQRRRLEHAEGLLVEGLQPLQGHHQENG